MSPNNLQPYTANIAQQRTGQAGTLLTCGGGTPSELGQWYSPDAVRHILADAHAHYEAQVRQLGGLARAEPARAELYARVNS